MAGARYRLCSARLLVRVSPVRVEESADTGGVRRAARLEPARFRDDYVSALAGGADLFQRRAICGALRPRSSAPRDARTTRPAHHLYRAGTGAGRWADASVARRLS